MSAGMIIDERQFERNDIHKVVIIFMSVLSNNQVYGAVSHNIQAVYEHFLLLIYESRQRHDLLHFSQLCLRPDFGTVSVPESQQGREVGILSDGSGRICGSDNLSR